MRHCGEPNAPLMLMAYSHQTRRNTTIHNIAEDLAGLHTVSYGREGQTLELRHVVIFVE